MIAKQRKFTEKLLFDYYMISSVRENEIHSPFPYYLEKEIADEMIHSAEVLNSLVCRIINQWSQNDKKQSPFVMGDFILDKEILGLTCPVSPFFWVRYDAFIRAEGGIFFSEFNYDKPCAQREIAVSDMINPYHNPNHNFRTTFRENFKYIYENLYSFNHDPTVAILISESHREEMHLAHFYMDLFKELNLEFLIVGTENIYVKNHKVFAFERQIDILLRQFPTEYLYQIKDIKEILALFEEGKFCIINDPRAIIAQTKSLFAYLWELVGNNAMCLTELEKETIRKTIPYTILFHEADQEKLLQNKDKYVIKAVYGRYSEQVYIGAMMEQEDWSCIIHEVDASEELHIVQEFCPIKQENVLQFQENGFDYKRAFGNFGIYLSNNQFCGCCIRWSTNYLSDDEDVWVSPVGIGERSLHLEKFVADWSDEEIFRKINDSAAFDYGYTGGYTGISRSFSLDALILEADVFEEIRMATVQLAHLFYKTTRHVQENSEILCPVLGISKELIPLVTMQIQERLSFLGRFDFVMDDIGRLKLLEFNAETPAGIIESIALNSLIQKNLMIPGKNPNEDMSGQLRGEFNRIIGLYKNYKDISKNTSYHIGFTSLAYPEDYYNTSYLMDILHNEKDEFVYGEITGLHVQQDQLCLYEKPIDAIYRFYPLDWLVEEFTQGGSTGILGNNTLCLNEPSTFISQSKAFFALIWELYKNEFYNQEEKELILKYIPYTSLNPHDFVDEDYCVKPYFQREGKGVTYSIRETATKQIYGKEATDKESEGEEMVYQKRVPIQAVNLSVHTTMGETEEVVYPILGAYVIGNDFGGIYTRAGDVITDFNAIYIPTYIKGEGKQDE